MSRYRIIAFFVFMALFSATFQAGTMMQVSEEDAAEFMEIFEELVEGIDGVGIFLHNATLALLMFLPGFGMVWGFFSAASTGYAFAAIAQTMPELRQIPPLAILYLTPFGLMELVAYSLATSRSYILLVAIIRKTGLRTHMVPTLAEVGILLGLLFAGGLIEHYMIEQAAEEILEMPAF